MVLKPDNYSLDAAGETAEIRHFAFGYRALI
jgi:hypothetical protein